MQFFLSLTVSPSKKVDGGKAWAMRLLKLSREYLPSSLTYYYLHLTTTYIAYLVLFIGFSYSITFTHLAHKANYTSMLGIMIGRHVWQSLDHVVHGD